jgi:hypothetical protein
LSESKRGRKCKMRHEEDVFWESDGQSINIEDTQFVRQERMEERGESKPEFVAPGAEQKWRARNLVDIHWALTAIKTPSESYNRVLSCIIDHANPHNGLCYPSQSIIAIETGYSVKTVKRAVNWWKEQGFLKTEAVASVMRLLTTRNGTCWRVSGWALCLTLRSKKRAKRLLAS